LLEGVALGLGRPGLAVPRVVAVVDISEPVQGVVGARVEEQHPELQLVLCVQDVLTAQVLRERLDAAQVDGSADEALPEVSVQLVHEKHRRNREPVARNNRDRQQEFKQANMPPVNLQCLEPDNIRIVS
jgi:hypothetical protein